MAAMRHPNVISLLGFCTKPPALVTGGGTHAVGRVWRAQQRQQLLTSAAGAAAAVGGV